MKLPELSQQHVQLLEVTYDGFREAGAWPTTSFVDAVLDQDYELNLDAVLADMPPGVVVANGGYTENSEVCATVVGLRYVESASQDLEDFVALIRAAADRERRSRPGPREASRIELTAADAATIWPRQLAASDVARVFEIVSNEGAHSGSRRSDDGDWMLAFNRNVRRYRDVGNIDEYLARRPDLSRPRWEPPPAVEPYVFVLMPFEESWSANVRDEINQACQQTALHIVGLRWQRADDITEPGRITDQIVSAIERADVLVADITGTNANVLFELGYADALSKPIIVLNQQVEQTPFDIKDWRQIIYSTNELSRLRQSLADFLAGSLRARGFLPRRAG
jgi:hypothetical protein